VAAGKSTRPGQQRRSRRAQSFIYVVDRAKPGMQILELLAESGTIANFKGTRA
jgi:hypothetical protein